VDRYTVDKRSDIMRRVRSRNTVPEQLLAKAFRTIGLSFRRHQVVQGTRPDFIFFESKVALFVDGCFWHGCLKCGRRSKSNLPFWEAKVKANRRRDRRNSRALRSAGWIVLRVWEHLVRKNSQSVLNQVSSVGARPRRKGIQSA
jgi:DNA mismatch endonuclease Vsr